MTFSHHISNHLEQNRRDHFVLFSLLIWYIIMLDVVYQQICVAVYQVVIPFVCNLRVLCWSEGP